MGEHKSLVVVELDKFGVTRYYHTDFTIADNYDSTCHITCGTDCTKSNNQFLGIGKLGNKLVSSLMVSGIPFGLWKIGISSYWLSIRINDWLIRTFAR